MITSTTFEIRYYFNEDDEEREERTKMIRDFLDENDFLYEESYTDNKD